MLRFILVLTSIAVFLAVPVIDGLAAWGLYHYNVVEIGGVALAQMAALILLNLAEVLLLMLIGVIMLAASK